MGYLGTYLLNNKNSSLNPWGNKEAGQNFFVAWRIHISLDYNKHDEVYDGTHICSKAGKLKVRR